MLREIKRTLKPGGMLRLSTPDLAKICGLMVTSDACYTRAANEGWSRYYGPGSTSPLAEDLDNPAFTVNRAFREWDHVFLWDERTLGAALEKCGFVWQGSELSELEHHGELIGDFLNRWESLVIEARPIHSKT